MLKKDVLQKKKAKDAEVSIMEYDHPILKITEQDDTEKEEAKEKEGLKGKALLKKVYQGGAVISKEKGDPCQEGYAQRGMKEKEGRQVPNCIPLTRGGARLINRIPKSDPIWKYSDPSAVQSKAQSIPVYRGVPIFRSTARDKKYQIIHPQTGKIVNFGAMGYEDYTHHHSDERRLSYLRRASGIKGNWRDDPFSANSLAINLLW